MSRPVLDLTQTLGEYYHDLDIMTNTWCVFHTEWPRAVASFCDEGLAKEEANKRNSLHNEAVRFPARRR